MLAPRSTACRSTASEAIAVVTMPVIVVAGSPALMASTVSGFGSPPRPFLMRSTTSAAVTAAGAEAAALRDPSMAAADVARAANSRRVRRVSVSSPWRGSVSEVAALSPETTLACCRIVRPSYAVAAGATFWFIRNTLPGSYFVFNTARRRSLSMPYAASSPSCPSSPA